MGFVKFTKTKSRIGTPKVSIWSRGQIGFNQGAVTHYEIDKEKVSYAVLYFDKDRNMIGIELTNDATAEGASKLIFREGGGVSFSAIPFLKTFGIDYSETHQFNVEYDNKSELYVVDLKSGD